MRSIDALDPKSRFLLATGTRQVSLIKLMPKKYSNTFLPRFGWSRESSMVFACYEHMQPAFLRGETETTPLTTR